MKNINDKIGNYRGFNFIVKFFKDGHYCGYVRLPEGNKFYGKDCRDIYKGGYGYQCINVHVGLNFS